jgi:hypothetical protein
MTLLFLFSGTFKTDKVHSPDEVPVPVSRNNNNREQYETVLSTESNAPSQSPVEISQVSEHEIVILDSWWGSDFMGVAVGFLVTVILILIAVIIFIIYKNHVNSTYEDPATYYQTFIPKASHPDVLWEGRRYPASPRRLPPTPTTSEEHYTDSSVEYSSPLLTASLRHQQMQQHQLQQHQLQQQQLQQQQLQHQAVHWESFFPSPPPGTPPVGRNPVSHYAASDLLYARGQQPEVKPGLQYFL